MDISTTISSLELKNPTILASGIMGEDAGSMLRMIKSNAGAVVTKSIGMKARAGYPNPTVVELEHGILNAMGLPNPGIEFFEEELKILRKSVKNTPIIGSVFGENTNEFVKLSVIMQDYGVDAVELNLSCPHVQGYGLEIGSNPDLVKKIAMSVKKKVEIPVFVKISPNVTDIVEIAHAAEEGHADAIVAINTVKAMKIDLEMHKPVLSNKIGGYSGGAIKPIGIRCVYEITRKTRIPVIGTGGIIYGKDAIEYFMAGASAVQIGAGVYYREPDVFKKVCDEIQNWMRQHGYKSLAEIIGLAHKG